MKDLNKEIQFERIKRANQLEIMPKMTLLEWVQTIGQGLIGATVFVLLLNLVF